MGNDMATNNPHADWEAYVEAQEQAEEFREAGIDWAVAKLTAELQDPDTVSDAMLVLFENTDNELLAEFYSAGDKMAAVLGDMISTTAAHLIDSGEWKFQPEERDILGD